MNKRAARIDYKSFHSRGVRQPLEPASDSDQDANQSTHETFLLYQSLFEDEDQQGDTSSSNSIDANLSTLVQNLTLKEPMDQYKQLIVQERVLSSDIQDFGTDYDIEYMLLDEIKELSDKFMNMRREFKSIHSQLEQLSKDDYEQLHAKSYVLTTEYTTEIIKRFNSRKQELRTLNSTINQSKRVQHNESVSKFLMNEVTSKINSLTITFSEDPNNFNYDELIQAEKNQQNNRQASDNLTKQMEKILSCEDHFTEDQINDLNTTYNKLSKLKTIYFDKLQHVIKTKEINKEQKFQVNKLNIELSKFKGYDSSSDIYTFKSDFEKLHTKLTPSALLPDLLKNNYLEGSALTLVKGVDEIDEIWRRLKASYGDPKLLLSKKLSALNQTNRLWRVRDPEKQIETLSTILNLMRDVMKLASQHNLEKHLFYSNTIQDIYQLLDDVRVNKWFSFLEGETFDEPDVWKELIKFLEKEISVQQLKLLHCTQRSTTITDTNTNKQSRTSGVRKPSSHFVNNGPVIQTKCFICDKTGHTQTNGPNGSKLIQYFSCPMFADMKPSQRFSTLRHKGLCTQCLFPGAQQSRGKHQDGRCQHEFVCPHPSHDGYGTKKHVLICQDHATTPESNQVLQNFKERCILRQKDVRQFSKDIKLAFHINVESYASKQRSTQEPSIKDNAIYILQTINVDGQPFTIFFDLGCSDMVITENAVKRLGKRASLEYKGDIAIGGVGKVQTISSGAYTIRIPLHDGQDAQLLGVCLPQITSKFPTYKLKQVEDDISTAYIQSGGNPDDLPRLPPSVGGEIDIMIGIKYIWYHPKEVFQLNTGLTLFSSPFKNSNGTRGVVGGPHHAFNITNQHHHAASQMDIFFNTLQQLTENQTNVTPDDNILHLKVEKDYQQNLMMDMDIPNNTTALVVRNNKVFEDVENAGSQITYRCVHCRDCKECKISESIESISLKEEVEQHLINQSVTVDVNKRISHASLPLLHDPETKLVNNKHKALKVYFQQLRKLEKEPSDKADVIASQKKLQSMGYVDYVENLTHQQQEMLSKSKIVNFIPWRAVWKPNSLSTPCRIVFDASQPTDSGYSLNDILAKGTNNMNRLVEILIRWTSHQTAFHTDIRKMYNTVQLREHHWCLQRYIWEEDLDKTKLPKEKVIKTLIYGVKSSGNQSERALRETGRLSAKDFPEASTIISKDVYVDDCLSGDKSEEQATKRADEIEIIVNRGGFSLKGVTFSHQPPKEDLTSDGKSISVAGMKWYPEEDTLSLDVSELNFAKKVRGKKPSEMKSIPINLTRRQCVSKVAELYDITGKITPLTATMKLDLHHLVDIGIAWDEKLPDNLRPIWESHFAMMKEISSIKYKRAIVPDDAVSLDITSIDTGDASKNIACVAIYARFKRKSGNFSCQLVFARSRLIPDGTTQPRGELFAATLNTHTGEVVRRAFGTRLKSSLKFTDSQIALFWINGSQKQLKPWVRSRVTEIHRFTELSSWKYVASEDMIADIGTRRGTTISDVSGNSTWFNGFKWMSGPEDTFPMKSVDQVKLSNEQLKIAKKEQIIPSIDPINSPPIELTVNLASINQRFEFAQYFYNPMKLGWSKALRKVGTLLQFMLQFQCRKLTSVKSQNTTLSRIGTLIKFTQQINCRDSTATVNSQISITKALRYFFTKATEEVQSFSARKKYEKISSLHDGILYYTGRILPANNITSTGKFTNTMLDLTSSSFFVPLIDRHSPIAYSIVDHVHWNHPIAKHAGVETTFRYVLQIAYIIDGRDLIRLVRQRCQRCRYLAKKTIDVEMGPVSDHNLNIAPPFYSTQVDLCGPFNAFSNFHKRTTVKIWLVIFCCTTTSATKIKIMDDYSTPAFLLSFTRFACEVGYPKYLLPDEGSQLVKGCSTLKMSFKDIQNQLFKDALVDFQTCPVSGHHMHGKVERKIQEIKKSLAINFDGHRFSILQWETIVSQIANTINDMPLALSGQTDFEIADVLTPNRLLMGRNNDRSPVFPMQVTTKPDKFIKQNEDLFNAWFEGWLTTHIPKLMYRPKWFNNSYHLKVGDIVLFIKQDSVLCHTYQYGKIKSVETSKDGQIRRVQVEYRNHTEKVNRTTFRATRGLVMIHPVDELSLYEELVMNN